MRFLEIIEFILRVHDEAAFDHEEIGSMLEARGVNMPWALVRDIIDTLHKPIDNGTIKSIVWTMRGFQIILEGYYAGQESVVILDRLRKRNYDWDHEFVCMIMLTEFYWLQSGSGSC